MPKKYEFCPVKECGKATGGKQYCPEHMNLSARRVLPTGLRSRIRSACCKATCIRGKGHDMGEQYCTKCKEPCCWKTM